MKENRVSLFCDYYLAPETVHLQCGAVLLLEAFQRLLSSVSNAGARFDEAKAGEEIDIEREGTTDRRAIWMNRAGIVRGESRATPVLTQLQVVVRVVRISSIGDVSVVT